MVIVLKCGGMPDSAMLPTPATVATEREPAFETEPGHIFDTERGLVHVHSNRNSHSHSNYLRARYWKDHHQTTGNLEHLKLSRRY